MLQARSNRKLWLWGGVAVAVTLAGAWCSWAFVAHEKMPALEDPSGHHHLAAEQPAAFFENLLKTYTPRQACMFYEQPLIWLHFISDLTIAVAYYSIPFALVYFIRRRHDLAFSWIFWMFAGFILACGTTHLIGVVDLWTPFYKIDGLVKLFTALLSIGTAIMLWALIPKALALPGPAEFEARVQERTAQLAEANHALQREMRARQGAEIAQSRLAAIVESSDEAIVGKTLEGTVTSWNVGAERLFGYSAEEMVGQPILKIIPPERRHEEPRILERLRSGERVHHFETVRVRKDGHYVDVSITASPIRNPAGEVVGVSKIARDIGLQKRVEREREHLLEIERKARVDAERAGRMKEEFLATVSHELRTPLNAILGWAQLLRRDTTDIESLKQGLDVIERNSRMQAHLIDELLDMSRIISGKLRLDVQRVAPASFVEAAIDVVSPTAEAKGVRLRQVLDPLAGPITGDPNRLQQVMWNLLANAVKFTPRGGQVEVRLERVNSHVEITVTDTGEGIPPDFLPHLFERFRQRDAASTRKHGGLGLGLALVKNLVEMHGGTVRAKSPGEGKGASFIVALPLRVVENQEESDPMREHPAVPSTSPASPCHAIQLEGARVLVVDDEPDARELIKRILEQCGANVELASSSLQGLEALKSFAAEVIVSDIGMPGQDGYAFLRAVREGGCRIPALALTAFVRAEDRLRALHAGYQMHLSKPVDPTELLISVASLAGRLSAKQNGK